MGLRIIGGNLKGKKLLTSRGNLVRPTGNRQREAIFNILSHRVQDASVLDLFAGTGALGIESLSRGARSAVFVDKDTTVLSVLEKNIRSCRLEDQSNILRWDVRSQTNLLETMPFSFDLVFMDPPYNRNHVIPAMNRLHLGGFLRHGADIVVEHSAAEPIPEEESAYRCKDQRRYGKTLVSFFTYVV